MIKREWLRTYDDAMLNERFDMVIASWDTASTIGEASDFSVGTIWGAIGCDFYLLDLVRGRFEVQDLRREILRLSKHWRVNATVIEDTELGRAMAYDLRRGDLIIFLLPARYDKEARLLAQVARFEAGSVYLPVETPWLTDYVSELLAFPNGRNDDQVDATSQALNWLSAKTAAARPVGRPNMTRRNSVRC